MAKRLKQKVHWVTNLPLFLNPKPKTQNFLSLITHHPLPTTFFNPDNLRPIILSRVQLSTNIYSPLQELRGQDGTENCNNNGDI